MGYYTRYKLRALDPTIGEAVDPQQWSKSYLTSVLKTAYPSVEKLYWDSETGDLFGSEPVKWYNHDMDLRNFSRTHPQFVWALRGSGEESGDEWILYAYRGSSYTEKQLPWSPPPPDMTRLPEVVRVAVPRDPPSPEDLVRQVIKELGHPTTCAAWDTPVGMDESQCDCVIRTLREALEDKTTYINTLDPRQTRR